MSTTLPVPLVFELPEGWVARDPDLVGAPGSAFVAGRPDVGGQHPPVITIDGGVLEPDQRLVDLADRSLAGLSEEADTVELLDRRDVGAADAPDAIAQAVGMTITDSAEPREVVQDQVYSVFAAAGSPLRAVVRVVLTSSGGDRETVLPEFQTFLRSIAVDQAGSEAE